MVWPICSEEAGQIGRRCAPLVRGRSPRLHVLRHNWLIVLLCTSLYLGLCELSSHAVASAAQTPRIVRKHSHDQLINVTEVELTYVVSFKDYKSHDEHAQFISRHIEDFEQKRFQSEARHNRWNIIPRHNRATGLPTDFVLLKFDDNDTAELLTGSIKSASEVRYLTSEKQFDVRALLSSTETPQDTAAEHRQRLHTRLSEVNGDEIDEYEHDARPSTAKGGRSLLYDSGSITGELQASKLWEKGFTGKGVKVAVFDTGLKEHHPHFRNIKDRSNWTSEKTLNDGLGHGTFVAGVIASQSECLGFAPDADLHIFRVFTNKQVSFTSWFLDAFNYAIYSKVNVLNLSIGGPDFMDRPFVDKVLEMSANNIIVVSAIGNDGPLYGTLNNPADQMDVIGVGGIDSDDRIAPFSSRGMTTWELPAGYGRVKPDVVTYGKNIRGSRMHGGCRELSGTSVASPVVAGAVTLLSSVVPMDKRWSVLNPASMKQALVRTANPVRDANIFEQGTGKLNLVAAHEFLASYTPHASVIPERLDLTDCPYMWPYCTQPLYHSGLPVVVNMTVLNGMSVSGTIVDPKWVPDGMKMLSGGGNILSISFEKDDVLWPWSGYLAVKLQVRQDVSQARTVEGKIQFTVVSDAGERSPISVPLKVKVIPTPAREKRVLWDQFHNLRYPSGYFPRDNLDVKDDILDWNGDHIHTNFKDLYTMLNARGYYVEVLGTDYTCIDARNYGVLMLVDPEEEYFEAEREKLRRDVEEEGLNVIVLAEWYNTDTMKKIKFFDDNTNSWWTPVTGGSNLPALNDLFQPWDISFSSKVYTGHVHVAGQSTPYNSGTSLLTFPRGGWLHFQDLRELTVPTIGNQRAAVMGLYETQHKTGNKQSGRIAVYGDSNCMDMNHRKFAACDWLVDVLLKFALEGEKDMPPLRELLEPHREPHAAPMRLTDDRMPMYSKVVRPGALPQCPNGPPSLADEADLSTNKVASGELPSNSLDGQSQSATDRSAGLLWFLILAAFFAGVTALSRRTAAAQNRSQLAQLAQLERADLAASLS